VLGALLVAWIVPRSAPATATPRPAVGYERHLLADGSMVELTGSAVVQVAHSARERRVILQQGEALFTVVPDPARPFHVRAGPIEIQAVGTAFSVRLEAGALTVLVTEGTVRVLPAGLGAAARELPLIRAGEVAVLPHASGALPRWERATAEDLARLEAWRPQLLDFSSTPLAAVLAELNRRNRVQLRLEDAARADVPIVASIRSDNLEGFLTLITAATGLRADRTGAYEIVLRGGR
jgi:transmembrane sensor